MTVSLIERPTGIVYVDGRFAYTESEAVSCASFATMGFYILSKQVIAIGALNEGKRIYLTRDIGRSLGVNMRIHTYISP